MKKLMSVLILFAMLLSLCACGAEESAQATTAATEATQAATDPTEATQGESSGIHELTNEDLYGHINQLEPMNGVYQIWSEVGVQNMADHPEAEFELLCSVDMQGATLKPIGTAEKPFTGKVRGSDFTISNFTVQGGDEESFGFIGVNQGEIRNLVLDNVTFVPGENAKHIGTIAGVNEGTVTRCTINNGAMTVENAPEGAACGSAVGLNTGSLSNTKVAVDLAYNAQNAATVGGVVGIAQGGELNKADTSGKFEVAGDNKTVGLFAGTTDVVLVDCAFLGAANTVNGQLYESFTGNEDDEMVTVTGARLRDNGREPLPENIRALRDRVVKAMYDMGTLEWKVKEDLPYTDRLWSSTFQYKGVPYNHKSSSLALSKVLIGEDGYLVDDVYDWSVSDSWDMYFGSDCSAAFQQAWWTVSNSCDMTSTTYIYPYERYGALPVGDWEWDFKLTGSPVVSTPYIEANGEERMFEAYAQLLAGDGVVYHTENGGHCRIIAEDAVVVRDQNGKIDGTRSYVISHEQGNAVLDADNGIYSAWNIGRTQYFSNLLYDAAVPVTCKELLYGQTDPVEAYLEDGCDGYAGMFSGIIRTTYNLDSVTLTITDSEGNVVLDKPFFPGIQKNKEFGGAHYSMRALKLHFNMVDLGYYVADVPFQIGESYSYTVTANLSTFDNIQVHEGSFTYGS